MNQQIDRPITPDPATSIDRTIGTRQPGQEYSTPHRTALKSIVWWESRKPALERVPKTEIFEALRFKPRQAYETLQDELLGTESARTFQNNPLRDPTQRRGPKPKILPSQIDEMEDILENNGWEGHTLIWQQLAENIGLEGCSTRLIRETMATRGYHICKVCQKLYASPDLCNRRNKWVEDMLAKYPTKYHWRKVRFSDECHSSFGPQGSINIIRKAGTRHHPDCVIEIEKPKKKKKNKKRKRQDDEEEEEDLEAIPKVHWWAAIGYDFKSEITFYDVPINSNGKMTHKVYIDQILDPIVKPWLEAGEDFVLEEDGDSGHGYSKNDTNNIVKQWKQQNGLTTYKNCAESPDLSPVQNSWFFPKKKLREVPHWDEKIMKELVLEGWKELDRETINNLD